MLRNKVVLLITYFCCALWLLGCPPQTQVPSVVGLTQEAAETILVEAGFTLGQAMMEYSDQIDEDVVIAQTPEAGQSVAVGSEIVLVISLGPKMIEVPDLVGLTETAAESSLNAAGLAVGSVNEELSESFDAGTVVRQDPPANTEVIPGSSVSIVISVGAGVVVPDITGLSTGDAENLLNDLGLVLGSASEEFSSLISEGFILEQSIASGTRIIPGSSVNIVVSAGICPVNVGVWSGKTFAGRDMSFSVVDGTIPTWTVKYGVSYGVITQTHSLKPGIDIQTDLQFNYSSWFSGTRFSGTFDLPDYCSGECKDTFSDAFGEFTCSTTWTASPNSTKDVATNKELVESSHILVLEDLQDKSGVYGIIPASWMQSQASFVLDARGKIEVVLTELTQFYEKAGSACTFKVEVFRISDEGNVEDSQSEKLCPGEYELVIVKECDDDLLVNIGDILIQIYLKEEVQN